MYFNKNKNNINKIKIITVIVTVMILNMCISIISYAQDTDIVMTFTEQKIYDRMKSYYNSYIKMNDDDTKTIIFTKEKAEELTRINLKYLELTDISDLSQFEKFTNLENLELNFNNINDITPLSNLPNLTTLDLSDNELNNLSGIGNLKKIENLYLKGNNLYDVNKLFNELKEIDSIKYLSLSNNNIENIQNLPDLLQFDSFNNLQWLTLRENKIYDMKSLEDFNTSTVIELYVQTILIKTNKTENIELPEMVEKSQVPDTIYYTGGPIVTDKCTVSSDEKTVDLNFNEKIGTIYLAYGGSNIGVVGTTITIELDQIPPKLESKNEPEEMTKEKVKVTITTDEEIKPKEGWEISEDKKSLSKYYYENIEEDIIVEDLAGNESSINIKVDNIQKDEIDNTDDLNNVIDNTNKDETLSDKTLPNAGEIIATRILIIIGIIALIIFGIVMYNRRNKIKK